MSQPDFFRTPKTPWNAGRLTGHECLDKALPLQRRVAALQ